MKVVAAIGVGMLVAAIVAFEVTVGDPPTTPALGMAAGLFAGAAVYDLLAGFIAYFAPLWIALSRSHPDAALIAVVNLIFGWTVIGWLAAMIWALSRLPRPAPAAEDALAPFESRS
ncbi:MAG TPA: superinfection immunity protein [Alphaproteobacteria bacterium]|nr:superinfection immunity protein [Alphaproteobacteria bacterium]